MKQPGDSSATVRKLQRNEVRGLIAFNYNISLRDIQQNMPVLVDFTLLKPYNQNPIYLNLGKVETGQNPNDE